MGQDLDHLSTAEADGAESSFAFDAHCVSRFVGLDSDSVSESISREAQISGKVPRRMC